MKKIILLVSVNTANYGAERSLIALARAINQRSSYEALVIIPKKGTIIGLLRDYNIEYLVWPFHGNVNHGRGKKIIRGLVKYVFNWFFALLFKYRMDDLKLRTKLVHSNTITSDFGIQLASMLTVPHIWHIREMAKLTFNFDFELGTSYILKMMDKTDTVIFNSETTRDYYTELVSKVDSRVIHNGVPEPTHVKNFKDGKNNFKILFIGRLTPEKNQHFAIRACKLLWLMGKKDFILDFWGDGENYNQLQSLIDSLGLSRHVTLRGFGQNIPIHDYSIGLSCADTEAFGRITAEYMMCGLPVVGVDSLANCELMTADTGMFYETGNLEQFGEALSTLYGDIALCQRLGENGRARAKAKFTEQAYGDAILAVYDEF